MSVQTLQEILGASPVVASTSDSILLIIDAQNEYFNGKLATRNVDATRMAIDSLLKRYRAASGIIIHVLHETGEGAPVFTPNTPLAQEFANLRPEAYEPVLHKSYPGAFTGTTLEELIKKSGKNKLVIVGYMAHICVSTTTRQAAEKGYDIVIPADAVGDRDIPGIDGSVINGEELTKIALAELKDGFATIVQGKDIQ